MLSSTRPSRRSFFKKTAAAAASALAAPYFVPARVLGKDGGVAPSNQITLGVMGYGNRCRFIFPHFLGFPEVRALAVADVRESARKACKEAIDKHHDNSDCKTYGDFREMFARGDIQAVLIATGNRWHAPGSIMAARAGKDIYCEKPICMTLEEGRALVETCKRTGAIYQAGHQRRSVDAFVFAVDAVRRGMIGKLHTMQWQVWENPAFKPEPVKPVPPGFDYDMWLGPSPWHPYIERRVVNWHYFWDTGDGMMTDMGCHWADLAQWANDADTTGPIEYEGECTWHEDSMTDVPKNGEVRSVYANGVKMIMTQKGLFKDRYIRFTGDKGWIQVDDHTAVVSAEPRSILRFRTGSKVGYENTSDHIGNWLRSIRTRQPTICNPETAFRAISPCLIATLCLRLGRKLRWDPVAEEFPGDLEANRMRSRPQRAPWHL